MFLQEDAKVHRALSYQASLHKELVKAETDKSPVKLINFKHKRSNLKDFVDDIEVSQHSGILSTEVDFEFKPFNHSTPPATTASIKEIMQMEDHQSISCLVYINVGNRAVVPVQLPYRIEPINKKEVAVNDDSGSLKLTLWDSKILDVLQVGHISLQMLLSVKVSQYKPHNQQQNHYPDFRERSNINKSTYRFGIT